MRNKSSRVQDVHPERIPCLAMRNPSFSKKQLETKEKDELKAAATKLYLEENATEAADGPKAKSLRVVCREISDGHFVQTGSRVRLHHITLANHAPGRRTMSEFNAGKHALTEAKQKKIVDFAIELADWGFPLSP
ncbi:hypothetical protein BT96DRAFT_988702 [Gymnopus androsaceus JB14]|uniref:Uncharacterized protein n=1 Tax=Gymnopus androsaceus JB14 TaxID=1447944 RepID=A0A6A4I8N8_9AGAR|nr:hypothetical protein BT96DRAFT_988702 [Gymnopus androsaceus JB14]